MSGSVGQGGTYKTFDEQREVLSPAEQRFEKARQTTGLILGPIVLLVMLARARQRVIHAAERPSSCAKSSSAFARYATAGSRYRHEVT